MVLILNMSSLQACLTLLKLKNEGEKDTVNVLIKQDPTYAHLNWENAAQWHSILEEGQLQLNFQSVTRYACRHFIISNPILLKLVAHGREAMILNLSDDENQVFYNAGLLEKLPSEEAVIWWDDLILLSRGNLNELLLKQGRKAEQWTVEYEKDYLKANNSDLMPDWLSLNGNYYGYDIGSYRFLQNGLDYSIQIEVKSFSSLNHPHFYLTPTEWQKADEAKATYYFYVWCMETKGLKILTVGDVQPHIPLNRGGGKWQSILIEFEW